MADPLRMGRNPEPKTWPLIMGALVVLANGCLPGPPTEVSPEEIPELERAIRLEPRNGERMLRYAAALFAGERCDSASAIARVGAILAPDNSLAPTVIGQCLEQTGEFGQAIDTYQGFVTQYPEAPGVATVRARVLLARRNQATAGARLALAREADLTGEPADVQAIAILPVAITGDSVYFPLGRGLAQMMISDLGLLQRFQLVERLQVGALLEELQLSQNARFDPSTTVRVGRLVRAGRMVQGLAAIPPDENVSMESNVVLANGQMTSPASVSGRLRELLQLEKELVIAIAAQLGYQVSEAERQLILENGTQSLVAFMAYSNGLVAEDLGDYATAATHFSEAVQLDPNFQQARDQYEAAAIAPAVEVATATQVTTLSAAVVTQPDEPPVPDVVANAVNSSLGDVAATQAEQTTESQASAGTQGTQQSTDTSAAQPSTTTTATGTTGTATGTIRIIFKLP